ncbi:hypothetical protein J1N35_025617 [Gossypium stocksii]|uniref:Uncharacterized protein n=1 Tax=Gossypium stocksii TaxID=47602 RepID=A0A9D3V6V3_9ROSI|nr:hypothetical protein J1N35_025617 [Gossypium stocksii]
MKYLLRLELNPNLDTRARHSISAFDFNFDTRSMSWGESSYTRGLSMYTVHQTDSFFYGHMGYRGINNLILSMGIDEGTSNSLLEGDNEGVDEEKDAVNEEGWL